MYYLQKKFLYFVEVDFIDCDFEYGYCGLVQMSDDELDWVRNSGPTPSDGTGPSEDNTLGNIYGTFI